MSYKEEWIKYYQYLEMVPRLSGAVNMYGATPYLVEAFGLKTQGC